MAEGGQFMLSNPAHSSRTGMDGTSQESTKRPNNITSHFTRTPKEPAQGETMEQQSITWHSSLETYFANTGEKAYCLSWCHKQAEDLYSKKKTYIEMPVIILSSVIGFMSVGSSSMFEGSEREASIGLGVASLFVGVLNTVGSYFQFSKRAEGHRISSIQYSRLHRFLQVELGLPRNERQTPTTLLKYVRDQYDRLQEVSPLLPKHIIQMFHTKFDSITEYKQVSKPAELNGLERISVYSEAEHFSINK